MSDLYYTGSRRSVELRQRLDQMRLERDRAEAEVESARGRVKELHRALDDALYLIEDQDGVLRDDNLAEVRDRIIDALGYHPGDKFMRWGRE